MKEHIFTQELKEKAAVIGFDACGVAPVEILSEEGTVLRQWLARHYQAGMDYMARNVDKREDPTLLVDNAKSVIVLLMNYKPPQLQPPGIPQIASYAYGVDYHEVIREKLYRLWDFIRKHAPEAQGRCFVDTAPVLERAWAVRAGLGWIGKNTLLLSREWGSFTFLTTLLTNITLEYDQAETRTYCGSCTRCIDSCPTGALREPYILDANRCISYHTIENKSMGEIDTHGYLFGCDICQKVCPWNKQSPVHHQEAWQPLSGIMHYTTRDWLALSEEEFDIKFKRSPLKRAGLEKLKRTAAMLNMNSPTL